MDAPIHDQDGLRSAHNHEFFNDATFKSAYGRGLQDAGQDFDWHLRTHDEAAKKLEVGVLSLPTGQD